MRRQLGRVRSYESNLFGTLVVQRRIIMSDAQCGFRFLDLHYVFAILNVQQFSVILSGQQFFDMAGAFNILIAQHAIGVLAAESGYGILGAPVFGVLGA